MPFPFLSSIGHLDGLYASLREVREADPQLADRLSGHLDRVSSEIARHYAAAMDGAEPALGLVFEKGSREAFAEPALPVVRGSVVQVVDPSAVKPLADGRLWRVEELLEDQVRVCSLSDGESRVVPASDVIGTGLDSPVRHTRTLHVDEIIGDDGAGVMHDVICGDNAAVLEKLTPSMVGKVDVTYIDPPYETGGDRLSYHDARGNGDSRWKHSAWLDFMHRRLVLARQLLNPQTGVIVVAIGDEQHHRLRMLMDDVFGESNFLSNVVWDSSRKNDARFVSNGADYMLLYARNARHMRRVAKVSWRMPREGVDEVLAAGRAAVEASGGDVGMANRLFAQWWKTIPDSSSIRTEGLLGTYNRIDDDGRVYQPSPLDWPGGGGHEYDVIHPSTGEPVRRPARGWLYREEKMLQLIDEGRVAFGVDESTLPMLIMHLEDNTTITPSNVFRSHRRGSSQRLAKLLGDKRFSHPKDPDVLGRWLSMMCPRDGVVLDFFAGSGSTLEAVLRLNAADGGSRRCVLVTNNEVSPVEAARLVRSGARPGDEQWESRGVFEHVTLPRARALLTGVRPDGSSTGEVLPGAVRVSRLRTEVLERPR